MNNKPYLIIITGRPGSGKSTFSKQLGSEIFMPVISRDEIKEGYVHTFGKPHAELSQDTNKIVTGIFFDTLKGLLEKNISVIAEAAFQHGVWSSMLEQFMDTAQIYFLICKVDEKVALVRFEKRRLAGTHRDYFHGDKMVNLHASSYDEPHLAVPTFYIDTTANYRPSIKEIQESIFG